MLRLAAATIVAAMLAVAAPAPAGAAADVAPALVAGELIVNQRSNLCLAPNGPFAHAGIGQFPCDRVSPYHRWERLSIDGVFVQLRNVGTGFCIDLFANSESEVVPSTLAQQFWCNTAHTGEHWWLLRSQRVGHHLLRTKINALCAEIEERSTAIAKRVRLNHCRGAEPSQQFLFTTG
jgi:hypothetical protein